MKLPLKLYFISLTILHIIYAFVFLGILSAVPKYVYLWNILVQTFLCVFLMYRYHPFRGEYKFQKIDASLIFGAAMLLLFNIISLPVFNSYTHYIGEIKEDIQKKRY